MKIIAALIILSIQLTVSAQTAKFKWSGELCELEGVYDAKKYTETELRNTLKLSSTADFELLTAVTPYEYADIKALSLEKLDDEYAAKSAALKNLDIVDSPFFEAQRHKKLKELEQLYRLKRATVQAYENPSVLRDFAAAPACVDRYAAPLVAGGDRLLEIWLAVNEDARRRNASPENIKRIYEQQRAAPDKLKYARMEVMRFGWWNCANQSIEYVENHDEAAAEFKKLFKTVKTIGCDEP